MNRRNTKKMIAISAACVLSAALITGCGSKKDPYAMVEYDVKEYVTLGTYTGLKVDEKITAVTDKDVQGAIDSLVEEATTYKEITNRYAKSTDKVTVKYVRTEEGAEADEEQTKTFEIGSGDMGEKFESQMINMAIDGTKTFTIEETVTADDDKEEKVNATYTVTVTKIEEKVVPEVTDAFIKEKTESDTIADFKADTRKEMEEENAESAKATAEQDLLKLVVDDSKVTGSPTFLYNINYNSIAQNYAMYGSYFGMSMEEYVKACGMSLDDLKYEAVSYTQQCLVVEALLQDLNMDITDEEYDKKIDEYVEEYQYESKDKLLEQHSKAELLTQMRTEKAVDYLYENSTVNKMTVQPKETEE